MNLCKKEQLVILKELISIEDVLIRAQIVQQVFADGDPVLYVDKERYLEMAIRIDPTDKLIIYRKTEYKSNRNALIFFTTYGEI